MRYWPVVFVGLGLVAVGLWVGGAARTIIGDAQIVFALALVALLVWMVRDALR